MKDKPESRPSSSDPIERMLPALQQQLREGENLQGRRPVDCARYSVWADATGKHLRKLGEHFARYSSDFDQASRSPIKSSRTMGGMTEQAYGWDATAKLENQMKVLQDCLHLAVGHDSPVLLPLQALAVALPDSPANPRAGVPRKSDTQELRQTDRPDGSDTHATSALRRESWPTEKVTLAWLWQNVPAKFWLSLLGSFVVALSFGVTVGQTTFVQELIGRLQRSTTTNSPAHEEETPIQGQGIPLLAGSIVVVEPLNIAVRLEPDGNYNRETGATHIGFFYPKNPMVKLTDANLLNPAIAAPADYWFSPIRAENYGLGMLGTFKITLKGHEFSKDGTTVTKVTATVRRVEEE